MSYTASVFTNGYVVNPPTGPPEHLHFLPEVVGTVRDGQFVDGGEGVVESHQGRAVVADGGDEVSDDALVVAGVGPPSRSQR